MYANHPLMIAASALAIALITAGTTLAKTQPTEDPAAEAQAFLKSPTTLAQAVVTAETAAGGKVSSIEYQTGENGAPDLIMAAVTLTDGSEKTVAINPVDGKVLNVTVAENDMGDGENGSQDGADAGADGQSDSEQDGENAKN